MNPIRVGLVGCGLNSENHLRAFSHIKGAQVVAVCDRDLSKAKEKASRYGVKQVFGDFEAMLKKDLDLVDVVTPTSTHAPLSLLALEAGIDTLVEKPMALTSKECLAMIGAAEKSSRTLCVVHNKLFFDSVGQIKKMIRDDQLSVSRMRISHYFANSPFLERWRLDEKSGGLLWDALVHHIYLTEYFLGPTESVYVVAKKVDEKVFNSFTAILQSKKKVGVCEFVWNTYEPFFEFQLVSEEGARFHVDLIHDYVLQRRRAYKNREVEALRSLIDDFYVPLIKWTGHLRTLLEIHSSLGAFPYKRTFHTMLTHILFYLKGTQPPLPITAQDGLRTIRVLEAAKKSIMTGKARSPE